MTKLQKDHMMILLESIDSKVQVTMESVSRLDNKIDAVRDELKEDIAVLDCKIMGLSKRVDSLDKKIDTVDKNLSERIDALDKNLSKRIDEVEKNLSERIDEVDKNLSDKIDAVHSELVSHRNDTELHRSQPKRPLKRVA
jgi:chaperonin cofactor prefoldin